MSKVDPFFDGNKHLLPLPDSVLRDLARNDAATRDYRKAAVEILFNRKSPYVKHTDLAPFVAELEIELEGIVFDHPALGPGPLSSSVTTRTMFSDGPVVEFTGFDDVQLVDKPVSRPRRKVTPLDAISTPIILPPEEEPDAS